MFKYGLLALSIPLGLAYLSQRVRVLLGIGQEGEALMTTYLGTYPVFMFVVALVAGIVAARRAVDKWRDSVRDEIYLVGEVLHNLDEVER